MNRYLIVAGLAVAVFVANAWSQSALSKGFTPKAKQEMKKGR